MPKELRLATMFDRVNELHYRVARQTKRRSSLTDGTTAWEQCDRALVRSEERYEKAAEALVARLIDVDSGKR